MAEKVTLVFDAHGNISADAVGFVGRACEETTAKILAGIGEQQAEHKKPEYFQEVEQSASSEAQVASRW